MFKNIRNIVKKEFDRFFKDRRLLITTILLPALFIYAMLSVMGSSSADMYDIAEDTVYSCQVVNLPDSYQGVLEQLNFEVTQITDSDSAMEALKNSQIDLLIIFPTDYDQQIADKSGIPNVEVYNNAIDTKSQYAYDNFILIANELEDSISNVFDINRGILNHSVATDDDLASMLFSMILPAMIILYLFAACIGIAPESIAGEKERGTIATLLVTPVSRTAIAIGKILSVSVFATLAGLASFASLLLALPNMMGSASDMVNMNIFGFAEYSSLLCIIVFTVLPIVAIISVLSAYAKSVKEATTLSSLLMILCSLSSFVTMGGMDFSGFGWRFVPIFNSTLCISDICSLSYSATDIATTCLVNLVVMIALTAVLTKMFNSEKIMFKK